jgi:hypothetical protein
VVGLSPKRKLTPSGITDTNSSRAPRTWGQSPDHRTWTGGRRRTRRVNTSTRRISSGRTTVPPGRVGL